MKSLIATKIKKIRKGDGVFVMVLGTAIGALVLIAFFLIAKDTISAWGESAKELVKM